MALLQYLRYLHFQGYKGLRQEAMLAMKVKDGLSANKVYVNYEETK